MINCLHCVRGIEEMTGPPSYDNEATYVLYAEELGSTRPRKDRSGRVMDGEHVMWTSGKKFPIASAIHEMSLASTRL